MRFQHLLLLMAVVACSSSSRPEKEASALAAAPPVLAAPTVPRGISGLVLGTDGKPVVGATVTVSPHRVAWDYIVAPPSAVVQTGADGRFQVGPLESGHYGLAAHAPGGSVYFGKAVTVESATVDVELRLADTSAVMRGAVLDENGRPIPRVELRLIHTTPPSVDSALYVDDIARVPLTSDSRFQVKLFPGEYTVAASAPGFLSKAKWLQLGTEPVTLDLRLETAPDDSMRQAAIAWAKQAAIPLQTEEPGHGFADLQPLKPLLEDARVVALGEATHGTRDFFQLKHRMLEFLVTELGFTVFAIEAPFSQALAINDYVLTGKGDPTVALKGLGMWPWQTHEVLDLILWMRAYNTEPTHTKKLKFHGVDMQGHHEAAKAVLAYLARVDPSHAEAVKEPFSPLLSTNPRAVAWLYDDKRQLLRQALEALSQRFTAQRKAYERRSSPKEWALALQHLRVVRQSVELALTGNWALRDRSMADNLRWVLDHEGPEAKAVVWAANSHVRLDDGGDPTLRVMGGYLREMFGRKLYVFGFAFHRGSFRASNASPAPEPGRKGVVSFTVPPVPEASLDTALASVGTPLLALDLRALPRSGPAYEWWRREHATRSFGAVYTDEGYPLMRLHVLEAYDGLLFVENTSAARPVSEDALSSGP
jgi:erythromycin esterase